MFSSTFSPLAHSLHQFQKTVFKNKVAETSCNSLGLSKDLVRNAYREAEGLVGYIKTIREEHKKSSSSSASKEIFEKQKQNYASLIFNNDSVSPSDYLETISSKWPAKWFRHVGERKCQVQIPLSKLMTPGKYFSTNATTTNASSSSWITQGGSLSSKNNKDDHEHITLPPHLQALAVSFEQVASKYLEEMLLLDNKKKIIPSPFEKGLFSATATAAQKQKNNNQIDHHGCRGGGATDEEERSSLLAKMKNKSVLRLWIYFGDETQRCCSEKVDEKKEESCRGHFDPGVVSVLLAGSEPGLQVHKTFTGITTSETDDGKKKNFDQQQKERKYEYATHDAANQADEEGWVNIGYDHYTTHSVDANSNNNNTTTLPSSTFCDTNGVLMNDTLLQVLTGGVAEHCFHRVVIKNDDDKKNNNNKNKNKNRIQIVLELRPDNADKWYKFAPTEDEKKELMKAWW